ncbi:Plipastatin synthase subunit D, partial [Operophtera brumata]
RIGTRTPVKANSQDKDALCALDKTNSPVKDSRRRLRLQQALAVMCLAVRLSSTRFADLTTSPTTTQADLPAPRTVE